MTPPAAGGEPLRDSESRPPPRREMAQKHSRRLECAGRGEQMRTLAIVPVKSFANAKQRLSKSLASGSRRSLVQAMFSDVIGGLRRMERLDAIAVVTDDVS